MRGWFFLMLTALAIPAEDTTTDLRTEHSRYTTVVGKLSDEEFSKRALELLGPNNIRLGVFAVYETKKDKLLGSSRGFDHCSYAHWRSLVEQQAQSSECLAVKEAIKIDSAILMRTINRECIQSSRLLDGAENPLLFEIDRSRVKVLHVSFSRPIGPANDSRLRAKVYAQTDVSPHVAEALLRQLRQRAGSDVFSVAIRSEPPFITECGFPAIYAFDRERRFPTWQAFRDAPAAGCTVVDTLGKIICDGTPNVR